MCSKRGSERRSLWPNCRTSRNVPCQVINVAILADSPQQAGKRAQQCPCRASEHLHNGHIHIITHRLLSVCLSVCVYARHRRLPTLLSDIDAETFTEALYRCRDGICKFWARLVFFESESEVFLVRLLLGCLNSECSLELFCGICCNLGSLSGVT